MPATAHPRPTAARRRRVRRLGVSLLAGAVLTCLGSLAGVAATAAWPTTVATRQYEATVRLVTDPRLTSTIHAPTVFGDLDVTFGGPLPAPGIEATLQVRDSITNVLAGSGLDIKQLQPSRSELDAALTSAAWQVAAKAIVAIALVMVVAWFVLTTTGSPLLSRWLAPAAGLLSAVLVAGSMATGYGSGGYTAVRTTGLLSLVRQNTGLLGDVKQRSIEATPYVRNMLALAAAVQERYTPGELGTDAAVRIIAVSDIHGANQYPLLKSLVESEHATAVIDAGDLVNFGTVREAEAAGLFTGIESLGVPYLFVRGNHDAHTPTDDDLVQRLRTIPNVVVLEPQREKEYTVASVGGLVVAGFGDPRWFGDGGQNTEQMQKPAIAAFEAAMTALADGTAQTDVPDDTPGRTGPFDILVGHEPPTVQALGRFARIRLNGHMHDQVLDGSRIGLGTFTGGGVVSHYIQSGDGSELAGEPYAFDVLAFSGGCRLTGLTRYQFHDLLEGRPTYDTVQVLNGETIEQQPPGEGRTCGADRPLRRWTVQAPTPAASPSAPVPSVTASLPSGSPIPTTTESRATPTLPAPAPTSATVAPVAPVAPAPR